VVAVTQRNRRSTSLVQLSGSTESYRDKVLGHAAKRLSGIESVSSAEATQLLRSFLHVEHQRLRMAHRCGASGRLTAESLSFVLDILVQHSFRAAMTALNGASQNPFTVVALGGYGRGELAPFSDLDLVFLHTERQGASMRPLVEGILRLLWDTGLTVGHSFQTVKECVASSRKDLHLQTALINTRLLAGQQTLFESLSAALEAVRRKRSDAFITAVQDERAARYGKFGDAVCLQEPNVKESAGGLRDLHTAIWVAHARFGCRSLADLRERDLVSLEEQRVAERAYDFLLRVRYRTHLLTSRKTDRLSLDLQPVLAKEFGYTSDAHLLASEKFMRDYYRRAKELYHFGESVLARTVEQDKRISRWFGRQRRALLAEPFSIRDGKLHLEGQAEFFAKNTFLTFDAFALAQAANVDFSHSLHEAVRHSLGLVDRKFRGSSDAAQAFLRLLRRRGRVAHALRLMHEAGFLSRYLPEFGRISLLIQHDLYHHYTIDEHTLKVIEALDELSNSEDSRRAHLRAVFDSVQDVSLLYLGLLLHDIGKGQGSGHVARGVKIAERVCRRLQLSPADAKKVILLVEHHITMAHISQRRDLTEPQVAADLAAKVGDTDVLNMLLLLSYADMNGVGPGVWSEWKGNLLWDLYERTHAHMNAGETPPGLSPIADLKEKIVDSLHGRVPISEIERHLALLPDRYVRTSSPETVAVHLRLARELEAETFTCSWAEHGRTLTELTICARDRHGLFADIAGTLAAHGIEILSAEINTREDQLAIDVLMLRVAATRHAIDEEKQKAIERSLESAISGTTAVAALVHKWQTQHAPRRRLSTAHRRSLASVVCDNKGAQSATIVEVRTADQLGLAYKIASAATAQGLEIVYAKITTEKSDAFDVFYVTDAAGERLSAAAMRELETAIMERLSNKVSAAR
jgi:[protein-PII] uridylyltransferase